MAPRRADDRVRRRPQARRGPPAGDVDLGGRRGRGRWRAGDAAEPRELLALAGWADPPGVLAGRPLAGGVGVDDPDAPDDLSPTVFVGPADGDGPARPLAPDLDRPIGHWNDTDLTGWTGESRTGPAWLDPRTVIAIVSDRGREVPWAFPVDEPGSAGARRRPRHSPERTPTRTLINLAVGGGAVTVLGALGGRAPELMTVERGAFRTRTSIGSRWQRRFRWPEMRAVLAPGSGGDVETWIASPPDAGDAALPTVVDIHGGPLGAWAPAPSIEVMLLVDRGFRVLLPNIRGSATYGRRGSASRWATGAASTPRTSTPRSTTPWGWGSSTRRGSACWA